MAEASQIAQNSAMRDRIALTQREAELASAMPAVRQAELDKLRAQQDAIRNNWNEESQSYKDRMQLIAQQAEAQEKLRIANGPWNSFMADQADSAKGWKDWQQSAVSGIQEVESSMASLVTGTKSAKDAAASLFQSLASMAANSAIKSVFGSVLGAVSGGGGGLGGLLGGAVSSVAGGAGVDRMNGSYGPPTPFLNGGIMTSAGSLPLHKYATGGVASTPQLALFAEGRNPEAFVPLPDGRSIPVSMRGAGGAGSVTNHTATTVNINMPPGQGGGAAGGLGGDPHAVAAAIAAMVNEQVVSTLHNESRTGGALNPTMR